jgi:PAS domain S-box-containing protein
MTDITERKKAEEELKASKKTLEDIIDFLPDATLVVDQGGTIIAWNQAIEKMTGVSKEDMIGRGGRAYSIPFYGTNRGMLLDLLALDDDDLRKEYDYVTREGSALYAETFCQALYGGKGAHLWGAATFIFDGQGNRVGAIESVRDISSLKQAEAALMEVNKKLNLLTSVTRHDINNQLMILTGQLALMEMSKPDHESNEQLRKAEAAAKQISAIIRFTKEYQGVVVYEPIWQDIRGYVESGSRGIPLGSIRLVNDVPSDTEVFADPLIAKVFPILIDNAVRHGGKITTIRFHVEERSGARVVICEDDGVGISAEMKKGLFTQSSEKGHGFGLFLSHQILAINGISLHENGEPGKGARFEIVIPAGAWRSR